MAADDLVLLRLLLISGFEPAPSEGIGENDMSDYILAFVIPLVSIAIVFAWVPFLNLICPPCARVLERPGFQGEELRTQLKEPIMLDRRDRMISVSSSSRGLSGL